MGNNVTFFSARYNFKTCDFVSGVVNVNGVIQQYCSRVMSVSTERLCQFILELIRCRDWYGSYSECCLDRDDICDIIKFSAVTIVVYLICVYLEICVFLLFFKISFLSCALCTMS